MVLAPRRSLVGCAIEENGLKWLPALKNLSIHFEGYWNNEILSVSLAPAFHSDDFLSLRQWLQVRATDLQGELSTPAPACSFPVATLTSVEILLGQSHPGQLL